MKFLLPVSVAMSLLFSQVSGKAEDFPARSITLIVAFVPGGAGDAVSRIVANGMSEILKVPVVIENVPGAGGTIGAARAARSKPDGYTIVLTHIGQAAAATLYRNLSFDPAESFEPIGMIAEVPMTVIGRKDFPAKSVSELIADIRTRKEAISMANGGTGSASHLCGLLFMSALKLKMTVVPYRSAPPALNDVMGGRIDVLCDQIPATGPQIHAGSVKAYAVTTKAPVSEFPQLPTLNESGLPGFDLTIWYGLDAPKGTPKPIIDKLSMALRTTVNNPTTIKRLSDLGFQLGPKALSDPANFNEFFRQEVLKWRPLIIEAGAYAD